MLHDDIIERNFRILKSYWVNYHNPHHIATHPQFFISLEIILARCLTYILMAIGNRFLYYNMFIANLQDYWSAPVRYPTYKIIDMSRIPFSYRYHKILIAGKSMIAAPGLVLGNRYHIALVELPDSLR